MMIMMMMLSLLMMLMLLLLMMMMMMMMMTSTTTTTMMMIMMIQSQSCTLVFTFKILRFSCVLTLLLCGRSSMADIRFQCMGSWMDENQNIYSAMADIGRDHYRERFRCMVCFQIHFTSLSLSVCVCVCVRSCANVRVFQVVYMFASFSVQLCLWLPTCPMCI